MTTVEITLPDQLTQEAQRVDKLFQAAARMSAVDDAEILSPEAVADEIAEMRAERRARACEGGRIIPIREAVDIVVRQS